MITTGMGRLNEFVQTVQNCTHGLELWDLWPKKAVLLMGYLSASFPNPARFLLERSLHIRETLNSSW